MSDPAPAGPTRPARRARSVPPARRVLGAGWAVWRALVIAQLRERPGRLAAAVAAIALGVALGSAVYWINASALAEFSGATRRLLGQADLIVRGPPQGFAQALYVRLAHDPAVSVASPMLDLEVTLPGVRAPLQVLGLDPFLAASIQPSLMGAIGGDLTALFHSHAIVLSEAAAAQLSVQRGATLPVLIGSAAVDLHVIDILPANLYPAPLGIMDIASAQWTLARLGRLNRIDLRLRPDSDQRAFRARLAALLPPGVIARTPQLERGRAATATRAYRVNLNMLALVALLTGAFLVFSTQSLSVMRRRSALGLLRALGLQRGQLQRVLLGEGVAIGAAGALLGVLIGAAAAKLTLHYLGADLGNRELMALSAAFRPAAPSVLAFFAVGTLAAVLGAWLPAREAARRAPALALRAGDIEPAVAAVTAARPGLTLLAVGAALAWLPAVGGLPLAGYASIAALLAGSILLVPVLISRALARLPRIGRVTVDTAVAQLQGSAGLSAASLAAMIVSFSLMVAMAIMVFSFRGSFDRWLIRMLPADIELRVPAGGQTASIPQRAQQRIAALPGIARVRFARRRQIYLSARAAPVMLIARALTRADAADELPLLAAAPTRPARSEDPPPPAWISEPLAALYGYRPGEAIAVPLGGRLHAFRIAGVWRDYVRAGGAIVIRRRDYVAATGDTSADQAAIWRTPGFSAAHVEHELRALLPDAGSLELLSTPQLRRRSLRIFDHAFAITYALEAAAVLIGLLAVSLAASSNALARRAQFGMLRHVGMLRRQVLAMLASEGLLTSLLAVLYGLALGVVLSLVLVYVVNRQSFHWSIDLAIPWALLLGLSAALVGAGTLTAVASGRAALSSDAIRAVREDW